MAESYPDTKLRTENEKGAVANRDKGDDSVDQNFDPENVTRDPTWRHGIDEKHEKRILRKLDIHLLPFVSLLYLLSFL
jgi:hypothetical protein